LDVSGCKNIYESFRRYTAKEMLVGENQYYAEGRYVALMVLVEIAYYSLEGNKMLRKE
jgi:hypothetical protein